MAGIPDVGTVPRSTTAMPRVAGVVVVRASGLPVTAIDDLAAPDTMRALREAGEHERAAAALAGTLSEGLYRAVPTIPDQPTRRAAVALRRDIHNGRWSRQSGAGVRAVSPALLVAVAEDLARWAKLIQLVGERRSAAAGYFETETEHSLKAMHRHLTGARVARGLAMASPAFTERLLAEPLRGGPDSRVVRTATAYLTRTALKTSPFSTLTTVGVTAFGAHSGSALPRSTLPGSALSTREICSARPLAVTLLLACMRHAAAAGTLELAGVEGLRRVDGRPYAVLPSRVVLPHTAARVDELTGCEGCAWALAALPTEPVQLAELLTGTGVLAEAGLAVIRRLLSAGVLQPVLPYPSGTVRDFAALARWARTRVPALPAGVPDALGRLAAQEEVIAGDAAASTRVAAVTAARAAASDAFSTLDQPEPVWLQALPLFHEVDAGQPTGPRTLPATVQEDLIEAARWLVPLTWRHPSYDVLVRGFVRRHGFGAAGVDLLEFLYAFLAGTTTSARTALPPSPDVGTARDPARLHGDLTLGPASHTIFFQLAAASPEQVAAGAHQTVVNSVHTAGLGLLGRWTRVPAVHEQISAPIAEWAHQLHPGCRVYQVCPGADWVDLQRPVLRTLPLLRLPGDLTTLDAPTTLSGMTVAHRSASDTLQVSDRDATPVAFAHLGTMPQHLLTGVAELLCLLSNPWVTLGRVDRDRRLADDAGGEGAGDHVEISRRVQRGRLVWARARWSFPVAAMPRPGSSELGFLADVERWWARHGLPEEAFVSHIGLAGGPVRRDRPQWIGAEHPLAIRTALGRIPPGTSTVDVSEALPCRAQCWVRDTDGHPIASEFLAMVRHA
jgi:hypothetical protein